MNAANIDGYNSVLTNVGTSYAAPVVAGYAAVVMQKFPNLSAANTSNIILDTARTDTINGYSAAIHGKGEASLSRALAPVGSLR
jgi:subtilisin family serine protease